MSVVELVDKLADGQEIDPFDRIVLERMAQHMDRMAQIEDEGISAVRILSDANTMLIATQGSSRRIPEEVSNAIINRVATAIESAGPRSVPKP